MAIQCGLRKSVEQWLVAICLLCVAAGCDEPMPRLSQADPDGLQPIPAAALLEKMRAAYRRLETYAGSAEVVEVAVRRGEGVERELPYYTIALAYQRPDRIRFVLEELTADPEQAVRFEVATGGELIYATAAEAPGQVHVAKAPAQLSIENFLQEAAMQAAVFQVGPENYFPHLVMLLEASSDKPLFPDDSNPHRLPSKRLGPHVCYRVALDHPAGKRVLWINERTMLLERVEVPSEAHRTEIDPEGLYASLNIRVDFANERVDTPIDPVVFALESAADARPVERFVEPPPAGPPEQLGQTIRPFEIETVEGKPFRSESLRGQTALLDFWFTTCIPCERGMPVVDEAYQALVDEGLVAYAVSIDPASVPAELLRTTLQQWGGTMPILRDAQREALDQLGVKSTPTTLLIDPTGRLQYIHEGVHRSAAPLIDAGRAVLAGVDLAAAEREAYAATVTQFEKDLEGATVDLAALKSESASREAE